MKKLILVFALVVMGFAASGQVTVAELPATVSINTTTTTQIIIDRSTLSRDLPRLIWIWIECPSTNASNVQINIHSATMTGSANSTPRLIAPGEKIGVSVKDGFYVKLLTGTDDFHITF